MRHLFTSFLSTAAIAAALSATPVAAQVAGNPGDQHTPTPYTSDYWAQAHGYAPGYGGPFGPIGAVVGSFGAMGGEWSAVRLMRSSRTPDAGSFRTSTEGTPASAVYSFHGPVCPLAPPERAAPP